MLMWSERVHHSSPLISYRLGCLAVQALLQQAAVAGQQAAGVSPDGNSGPVSAASVAAGQKLLDRALQLCRQYNVSAWRARLEFVCAAIQSATQVPVEVRQDLVSIGRELVLKEAAVACVPYSYV